MSERRDWNWPLKEREVRDEREGQRSDEELKVADLVGESNGSEIWVWD